MKINKLKKIRHFIVGNKKKVKIKEVAKINIKANEQIVFQENNQNYDFVKKSWGYYATPSVNKRLKNEGYKTAIIINLDGLIYIVVVNIKKIKLFNKYCKDHNLKVLKWLDMFKKK